jgi:integrase
MYSDNKGKAKIGNVNIDIKGKSYRLRFTYPKGTRHELSVAKVSDIGYETTIKAARLIDRDIELGDLDFTYARYSHSHAKAIQLATEASIKTYNLLELWLAYKKENNKRVAKTTQKRSWKSFDLLLSNCPVKLLELSNSKEFVKWCQSKYADTTIASLFRTCLHPAVNYAVNNDVIGKNPYQKIQMPKIQKKAIEAFEPSEVLAIIGAFKSDDYVPKSSRYLHSHYAPVVEFLALTGCRPEEAYALTWDDIKMSGERRFVVFNKAYSAGILMNHTKTHTARMFPCNSELNALIDTIPHSHSTLVFPSIEGTYIDQNSFRRRAWKTIVDALVVEGKVKKYLKPYCLRHSFITRLVREGVDLATIASLSGNSPEVILSSYLATRNDFELPTLR